MRRGLLALTLAGTIQACFAADTSYAQLGARLKTELDRLEAAVVKLDSASLPEGLQSGVKTNRDSLARARATASPLLRLYRLRDPFISIAALTFVSSNKPSGEDLQRFQELWKSRLPRFESRQEAAKAPVLQSALHQAAANRAEKLFRASLPYAKVSSPVSGLYYLGEAEGNLAFREFIASLPVGKAERENQRPELGNVNRKLNEIDNETVKTFGSDPAGRTMIPVSARLKEARELADRKWADGASLLLLEARLYLSRQKPKAEGSPAVNPETEVGGQSMPGLLEAMAREESPETGNLIRADLMPLYTSLLRSRP